MAKTYTYTEARQNLASVLAQAEKDGEVLIIHRSGRRFVLRRLDKEQSPLDVPGVDTGIGRQEVINSIREGREMDSQERRSSY